MKKKPVVGTTAKKRAKKVTQSPEMQSQLDEVLRQMSSLLAEQGVSESDLASLAASLDRPSAHDDLSEAESEAKFMAQELAFEAMEARSSAETRKLAKRALKLDPDCVDALVALNDVDAQTLKESIEGLQRAVAAGERSLGEKFMREHKGHFWMAIETRPYMRALEQLASEMASPGMHLDAIGIYETMLKLNPNDNQGVRDPLLGLYLVASDVAGAGRLLKRYKGDATAAHAWGLVLERFLDDDRAGADAALPTR